MKTTSGNFNFNKIRFPVVEIKSNKLSKSGIKGPEGSSFNEALNTELEKNNGLKFSGHAMRQINFRGINVGYDEVLKLNNAVKRADEKGARESLILMNDLAFIVNIKNKTVVTAVDDSSMKEKIFTNIDSTIIL